jgi:hypothetical protein
LLGARETPFLLPHIFLEEVTRDAKSIRGGFFSLSGKPGASRFSAREASANRHHSIKLKKPLSKYAQRLYTSQIMHSPTKKWPKTLVH